MKLERLNKASFERHYIDKFYILTFFAFAFRKIKKKNNIFYCLKSF